MKTYPMDGRLLQRLVTYLEQQPYHEVVGFMGEIQGLVASVDGPKLPSSGNGAEAVRSET
jgi:hypothetical protein